MAQANPTFRPSGPLPWPVAHSVSPTASQPGAAELSLLRINPLQASWIIPLPAEAYLAGHADRSVSYPPKRARGERL